MITSPPSGPRDYGNFEPNSAEGFNRWTQVEVPQFNVEEMATPISIYAMVLESSSRQSEVFVHDPLRALTGWWRDEYTWDRDGFQGDPILDRGDHRVNSVVLRHERTLEWRVVRALAIVDGNGTVTLINHKQEG